MGVLLRHWNTEVQGRLQLYEMILNGKMESLSQLPFLGVEHRQAYCPMRMMVEVVLRPYNPIIQGRLQPWKLLLNGKIEVVEVVLRP